MNPPDLSAGFAILVALFGGGGYNILQVKDDDVTGGQTIAHNNIQLVVFNNPQGISNEIQGASVPEQSGKIYAHNDFEIWAGAGFIPANEPDFSVWDVDYVWPL